MSSIDQGAIPTGGPASKPEVHVHNVIEVGTGNHVVRIVTTLLICAVVWLVGWAFAQVGWAERAATGIAAILSMWIQLQFRAGLISLPQSKASDDERVERGKSAIRDIWGLVQAVIDRSSSLRLLALSVIYGVIFVISREGVALGLTVFSNPFIAGAAGCLVGALIIGPSEVAKGVRFLRAKSGAGQ